MPNRFMYVLAVTLPVLMACGSSSSNETYTSPYTNALSRAELEGANTRNAYEAVERLRPAGWWCAAACAASTSRPK